MMNPPDFTLDELFDAIVLEESEPSHAALSRWIGRYPAHRDALVRFFAAWALQTERDDESAVDIESMASRTVSYALSALDAQESQTLFDYARVADVPLGKLVLDTGLDDSMLQKLNRRLIRSVPRTCVERLAACVKVTHERIQYLIMGPPLELAAARFKARKKPEAVTEDFATAVKRSSLSPEAQQAWLEIAECEKEGAKGI
jgi:hypothetical protein